MTERTDPSHHAPVADVSDSEAKPRLSYDRVAAAAQQMRDEGVPLDQITAARLRAQAGHGGNTTWHRHLQQWKARQLENSEQAVAARLPPQAAEAGQQLVARIWNMALTEARSSIERERQGFSQQAAQWQQEQASVLAELAQAEQGRAAAEQQCDSLKLTLTGTEAALASSQAALKQAKAEKKALSERHRGLRQQFNQQQQLTASAEARAQLAEKSAIEIGNRLEAQRDENTALKLSLEAVKKDLAHSQQRGAEQQTALRDQAAQSTQLRSRLDDALQQLAVAEARLQLAQDSAPD